MDIDRVSIQHTFAGHDSEQVRHCEGFVLGEDTETGCYTILLLIDADLQPMMKIVVDISQSDVCHLAELDAKYHDDRSGDSKCWDLVFKVTRLVRDGKSYWEVKKTLMKFLK